MADNAAMPTTFADLDVPPSLARAIAARGYETPTPVQEAVLGKDLRGRDLLVSSRTGSGKTVAFGLAVAQEILPEGVEALPRASQPLALVVAPTRELALQVATELSWLFAGAGARVATCVGGTDMGRELRTLRDGPHLVVGTPGRLVDHLERKSLKLGSLRALVLDEADEMLDMGFRDELERILRDAPEGRRTLLFSATIPTAIEELARRYQRDAARVAATPPKQAHLDIEVRAHLIAVREREHAVVNTLRLADAQSAIVFCGTREQVNHLHANLVERGFAAVALSGELTQSERTRALKALRDGRARVLVATDVAARGLDLPDVGIIIQADLPQNAEVFQHRSGRTGRAGRKGISVLLVPGGSQRTAQRILTQAGVRANWSPAPGPELIRARDRERLATEIAALAKDAAEDDLEIARDLLRENSAESLAAALVKLRREALPAPEELPLSAGVRDSVKARPAHKASDARPTYQSFETSAAPASRPAHKPAATRAHKAPDAATAHKPRETAAHKPREADAHKPRETTAHKPRETVAREPGEAALQSPWQRPPPTRATVAKGKPHEPLTKGAIWFSVNVGRSRNADPRWLLPLICRRGGVFKADIGKIQIMAEETRFEISSEAATRFERAAGRPDEKDPSIHIGRAAGRK